MKIKDNVPQPFKNINGAIGRVRDTEGRLRTELQNLIAAYDNQEALRQKASDDGEPGSEEAFFTPIYALEDEALRLIEIADSIKSCLYSLKSRSVVDWDDLIVLQKPNV